MGKKEKAEEAAKNAILAADETYSKDWVQTTLVQLVAYYRHRDAINRKIAQEKEMNNSVNKNKKLGDDK